MFFGRAAPVIARWCWWSRKDVPVHSNAAHNPPPVIKIHIKREASIQFRAEAFDIFKHANFHNVSTAYGSGNFGAVTSALDLRIMEFALLLHY
jgi:hypothetical protein